MKKSSLKNASTRAGFTLIELLVVISIIAILATLLVVLLTPMVKNGIQTALDIAFLEDHTVLVEQMVSGREVECAVLQGRDGAPPRVSVAGEIVLTTREFYDFDAKYHDAPGVELVCPADLGDGELDREGERPGPPTNVPHTMSSWPRGACACRTHCRASSTRSSCSRQYATRVARSSTSGSWRPATRRSPSTR